MINRSNRNYLSENIVFLCILLFLFLIVPEYIINSPELPCLLKIDNSPINQYLPATIKLTIETILSGNALSYILSNLNINLIILSLVFFGGLNFFELNHHIFSYPIMIVYIYILDLLFEGNYSKINAVFLIILTFLWTNINTDIILGLLIVLIYSISHCLEINSNFNNLSYKTCTNSEQSITYYNPIYNVDRTYQLILDKYKVDWILIPFESALSVTVSINPNWIITYNNYKSCIFIRAVKTYNK